MALPREVLESIATDIAKAESSIAELKDIVGDMRLSGMDSSKQEEEVDSLNDKLRSYKVFYERQKAKAL